MAEDSSGRAIFISYRRDDTEGEAGRLYDDLARTYGDSSVFMDVAGIQPGLDFRKAIDANVATCGVLLAVIGPTWGTVTDAVTGTRRLDNPNDFVRIEIASALHRDIPVIPVLVHSAKMPPLEQLPEDLKDLRYRNSVELTHVRWNSDVALLVAALKSYVTVKPGHETETVHANVPVQLPAPETNAPTTPQSANQPRMPDGPVKGSRVSNAVKVAAIVLCAAITVFIAVKFFRPAPAPYRRTDSDPAIPISSRNATPMSPLFFLGSWRDANPAGSADDLVLISVERSVDRLEVHAWGNCPKIQCDWGTQSATIKGDEAITEVWTLRNLPKEIQAQRTAQISLRPVAGSNQMLVTVKNLFHQPDGLTSTSFRQMQFYKVP